MKVYWMIWGEKKHGRMYSYIHPIMAESVSDAYGIVYRNEQNERRILGRPHMFHVKITRRVPYDAHLREKGHLFY